MTLGVQENYTYVEITDLHFEEELRGVPSCLNIDFKVVGRSLKGLLFHPAVDTTMVKNKIYLERLRITLGELAE